MSKSTYKHFVHGNLGVSLDIRLGLPNILLNTYALGFRHVVIDISPEEVIDQVISQDDILNYRTHSYSVFTYLRCKNLMLTVPKSRLRLKQEACFIKLYNLAKSMRCKAIVLNTAPNLQSTTQESFESAVKFLEKMLTMCDADLPIYLETTPPIPSHIGNIESLRTIVQTVGRERVNIALNSSHAGFWKFNKRDTGVNKLDWCLLEYGEYIKLIFLEPERPYQSLEEEGDYSKIESLLANFPGIMSRTRLSDVFYEKNFILSNLDC